MTAAGTVRVSATTASDRGYHWRPCDVDTPRGVKLQLIDRERSGVAVYGQWQPGSQWTHWAPLPTFADSVAPEWSQSGADELAKARREIEQLRRWKSTHAPRIQALEGLLRAAQIDAAKGAEAIASLDSERAANARLTNELEAAGREIDRLRPLTCCGCGDEFTEHDPGTCGNCLAALPWDR